MGFTSKIGDSIVNAYANEHVNPRLNSPVGSLQSDQTDAFDRYKNTKCRHSIREIFLTLNVSQN